MQSLNIVPVALDHHVPNPLLLTCFFQGQLQIFKPITLQASLVKTNAGNVRIQQN